MKFLKDNDGIFLYAVIGRIPLVLFLVLLMTFFLNSQVLNAQQTEYTITTVTGKKGTDADIIIKLYGTHGEMTSWSLPLDDKNRNDFWPGATDVFKIWENQDIGIITDVEIKGKGSGLYVDPWEMASMTVSSNGEKGKDEDGKPHISRFIYKDGKSWIDQDDIDARYPKFRSLMLSDAQFNTQGGWIEYNKWVEVNDFWEAKGGLFINGDKGVIDFASYNSSSASSSSRDNTSIENEASLSITHSGPVGPEVQASYRLKVAKEIEKMKSAERTIGSSISDGINYDVPANTIEFIHIYEQEKRVGGYFENNTGNKTLDDKKRWIVKEQKWVAGPRLQFRYVDEVVGGHKFEDLYRKAFPGAAIPTSPKTPIVEPTPPAGNQPVPVKTSTATTNVINNNTTINNSNTNTAVNNTNTAVNNTNIAVNNTNTNTTTINTTINSISEEALWEDLVFAFFERDPYENGTHGGFMDECPTHEGQLTWTNDDDVSWNLIPDFTNNRMILSDDSSPFKGIENAKYFSLYIEDGSVYAFEFMEEIYYRSED